MHTCIFRLLSGLSTALISSCREQAVTVIGHSAESQQALIEMLLMFSQSTHCKKTADIYQVRKRCCQQLPAKCCVRLNSKQTTQWRLAVFSDMPMGFFWLFTLSRWSPSELSLCLEMWHSDIDWAQAACQRCSRDVWGRTRPYNPISMPYFFF